MTRRHEIESLRVKTAEAITRFVPKDGDFPSAVSGVKLIRRQKPGLVVCELLEPAFAVVAQGEMIVSVGRKHFVFGEQSSLLSPLHLPTMTRITKATSQRPFLGCVVRLDMQAARKMIAEGLPAPNGIAAGGSALTSIPVSAELLDAILRLVRLNDRPKDIPLLAKLLQQEILYRLLTSAPAEVMRQIGTAGSRRQRVTEVVDWLRANFREPLRVEDLAVRADMGVSTLHHHFRVMTGSSPLQFQKQLRLFEARRMMLTDGIDVGSAAFATGYESATQFNREYRRQFGQPPRRDIVGLQGKHQLLHADADRISETRDTAVNVGVHKSSKPIGDA